jgi:hypothetical protein
MLTDIHDGTVFRIKLPDCVVSRHTAVLTECGNDLVLEFSFEIYLRFLPLITCAAQNAGFL